MEAILEVIVTFLFGAPTARYRNALSPIRIAVGVVLFCFVTWMALDIK